MKTLWTLIKSNPVYKISGAMVMALVVFAIFNIVGNCTPKHQTSALDVAVQQAIDSVKSAYSRQLQQHEDSIQQAAIQRDELWQKALQAKQAEANKYYNANIKNATTIKELKAKYAEPCAEIITEYDKREDNYIKALQAERVALTVCEKRVIEWQGISASKETQLTDLNNLITEKNKTIETQRDRITTITNRSRRNFVFRNWKWIRGEWREFVLEK